MGAKLARPTIAADGVLSKDQVDKAFRLLDADNSGELEPDEMLSAMKILGFGDMSEADLKQLISEVDVDGDNSISVAEFSRIMEKQGQLVDTREEAKKAYSHFDFTGSGRITFRSLRKIARELHVTASDEVFRQMIAELDTDGDGIVTEADFVRMLSKA